MLILPDGYDIGAARHYYAPIMDPWGNVLPSVVTSLVTTLVTLAVALGAGKWKTRAEVRNGPIALKRGHGPSWMLVNRSKKYMSELQVYRTTADGTYRGYPGDGSKLQTTLYPRSEMWLPALHPGESLTVNWVELRRNRPHRWRTAEVRIKADVEEYYPQAESNRYYGQGGGK